VRVRELVPLVPLTMVSELGTKELVRAGAVTTSLMLVEVEPA
jgi:hypothetical protein